MSPESLRGIDYRVAALLKDELRNGVWYSTDGSTYSDVDGGPKRYSTRFQECKRLLSVLKDDHCEPCIICGENWEEWECQCDGNFGVVRHREPDVEVAICKVFLGVYEKVEVTSNAACKTAPEA